MAVVAPTVSLPAGGDMSSSVAVASASASAGRNSSVPEERGKSCHQCRQMKYKDIASCKNVQTGKVPFMCSLVICQKCLLNRYGEKVEEVANVDGWCCPRCRGVCNCSVCMKRRGNQPTGLLAKTAKSQGFTSVMELLNRKRLRCSNEVNSVDNAHVTIDEPKNSIKELKGKVNEDIYIQRKEDIYIKMDMETELPTKKVKCVDGEYNLKAGSEVFNGRVIHDENNTKECTKADEILSSPRVQMDVTLADQKYQLYTKDSAKDVNKENNNISDIQSVMENKYKAEDRGVLQTEDDSKDGVKVDYNCTFEQAIPSLKSAIPRNYVMRNVNGCSDACTILPQGTIVTSIGGVELSEKDIGPALQFLEFCSAFAKVLDIKKGQPEAILRELSRGVGRRGSTSTLIQLHIKMLNLLYKDSGKSSLRCTSRNDRTWLQALHSCFTESKQPFNGMPLDFTSEGIAGYDALEFFQKLSILNFLCDEILNTEALRSSIEKENLKYVQMQRKAREKALAEKEKEECHNQQIKDGGIQAMLSNKHDGLVSVSKHDNSLSEMKKATKKLFTENAYRKHRSDALRTESLLFDGTGRVFWRLKGHRNGLGIMLQDVKNRDLIASQDKWFIYDDGEEQDIEKHISCVSMARRRRSLKKHVLEIKKEEIGNHAI